MNPRRSVLTLLLLLTFSATVAADGLRINLIPKGTQHLFWKLVVAGAEQAAAEQGVELYVRAPGDDDNRSGQALLLRRAIELQYDGIVLAPNHRDNYVDLVARAVANGSKVVVIDSAMTGDAEHSFVATDNYQAGRTAGRVLAAALSSPGRVLVLRYLKDNASTERREQGVIDALEDSGIEIVEAPYVGASVGEAFRAALELLLRYPDIEGIFAPNESATEGLLRALRSRPPRDSLKVVGFDLSEALIDGVRGGYLHALLAQQPYRIGYLGVRQVVAALRGEAVAAFVPVATLVVDSSNVDSAQVKAILSPAIHAAN